MCGIFGVWNLNVDIDSISRIMSHRGRDDLGVYLNEKLDITLIHRRLSIIDVEKGHQPIYNEDKSKLIICNGEIYNYVDLRNGLKKKHSFLTSSDTEVILHLFEDKKARVCEHLDGMFAFCIFGGSKMFLARDPFGVKPLYYFHDKKKFAFSSEFKALLSIGLRLEDIHEFPPGCFGLFDGYNLKINMYFNLPYHRPLNKSCDRTKNQLRFLLSKSVKKMLVSDVPVGCLLSGGIDSSIVAFHMSEVLPGFQSFCVGLAASDDKYYSSLVAEKLNLEHDFYELKEKDILSNLVDIIWHLESASPLVIRNSIPSYFVSRLASRKVKVVLCGEGSDELYAGYDFFLNHKNINREIYNQLLNIHKINLIRVDKMSMAFGLEARVPFLDVDHAKYALNIDSSIKIKNGVNKYVLRKAYDAVLPKVIVNRRKLEFQKGTGVRDFIKNRLRENNLDETDFFGCLFGEIFALESVNSHKIRSQISRQVIKVLK